MHKLPEVIDYKKYKEKLLKIIRELNRPHTELMHLANNRTFSCEFLPLKDGSLIVSIDDISKDLSFERTLNEQIAVQAKLLTSISEPIFIVGQSGRLKSVNDAFTATFDIDVHFISTFPRFEAILEKISDSNHEFVSQMKSAISDALESRAEKQVQDLLNQRMWDVRILPDSSVIIIVKKI